MNAIQTTYNGVRYRSRTEARWAVFLDKLEIEFTYEPEGYIIEDIQYLVDFWIPSWDIYMEVKNNDELSAEEIEKCKKLSQASRKKVFLVNGAPGTYRGTLFKNGNISLDGNILDVCAILPCRRCERMTIYYEGIDDTDAYHYSYEELGKIKCDRTDCGDRMPVENEYFRKALQASKNERFGVYE